MQIRTIDSLAEVDAQTWNALNPCDNPFLRHEFLLALEQSGCVGPGTGWIPIHVIAHNSNQLVGAVPLYLKEHSYGEFVFDWAWADAYQRYGIPYYPKLVSAVPFTPATGPRLLTASTNDPSNVRTLLVKGVMDAAHAVGASSVHWLFTDEAETPFLAESGLLQRVGMQFHWHNAGYASFAEFLAQLSAKKRKNVNRERRHVREAGITLKILRGSEVNLSLWKSFHRYYATTSTLKGGTPYLTAEFFVALGRTLPEHTLLVTAWRAGEFVAGALCLRGGNILYGRHWGSRGDFDGLHFEACYYTPLEYCIREGITRFEAGAQGEHKLSRGFLPTPTYSAHWVANREFREAIARFVTEEARHVDAYMNELTEHSPFRRDTSLPAAPMKTV